MGQAGHTLLYSNSSIGHRPENRNLFTNFFLQLLYPNSCYYRNDHMFFRIDNGFNLLNNISIIIWLNCENNYLAFSHSFFIIAMHHTTSFSKATEKSWIATGNRQFHGSAEFTLY